MDKVLRKNFHEVAALALIGFVIGYFIADDSAELKKIRTELDSVKDSSQKRIASPQLETKVSRNQWDKKSSAGGSSYGFVPVTSYNDLAPIDQERTRDLIVRREQGEYLLQFEMPPDRQNLTGAINQLSEEIGKHNDFELTQKFAELGLSSDVAEQLKIHHTKIAKASIEADTAIQQVLKARVDYDGRIRSNLTEEQYKSYKDYEQSRAAVREHASIQKFISDKGFSFDGSTQETLLQLIKSTSAYTINYSHGPYDGLPKVAVGSEMVAQLHEKDVQILQSKLPLLNSKLDELGFSPEASEAVRDYYNTQLQGKQRMIEIARGLRPSSRPTQPSGQGND